VYILYLSYPNRDNNKSVASFLSEPSRIVCVAFDVLERCFVVVESRMKDTTANSTATATDTNLLLCVDLQFTFS